MIESKLCPHDRLTTAFCNDCALEAEIYRPNTVIDWDGPDDVIEHPLAAVNKYHLGVKPSEQQIGGDHYKSMTIQPSEFIHRNNMNWCEGSAIKYICRHHLKGGKQDLEKAIHYLNLLIEWEYAESASEKK